MKFSAVAALATLVSGTQAHYIWQYLQGQASYVDIRPNTNYNSPVTDLTSNDLRCNVGGASGASTATYTVAAGGSLTLKLDTAVYHQGPVSFYLSKAPSTAATYDGSGDWFKIKDIGPVFSGGTADWTATQQGTFTVQLPSCIAAGEYLLRPQQLAIHNPGGVPQFYVNCAQLKVTGGGSKAPSPMVKIPGYIKGTEPGYTANIYNNFTNYTIPGPAVFTC